MSDEIREANLTLLLGLKRHLEDAEKLRQQLDQLIKLAGQKPATKIRENTAPESETYDDR